MATDFDMQLDFRSTTLPAGEGSPAKTPNQMTDIQLWVSILGLIEPLLEKMPLHHTITPKFKRYDLNIVVGLL